MKLSKLLVLTFFLSVDFIGTNGQDVETELVECFTDGNCASGADPLMMTRRDCCVNTPEAIGFRSEGVDMCNICVVFGFLQSTFTALERGQGYALNVGYLKKPQEGVVALAFTVRQELVTAKIGDFTLQTAQIVVLPNQAERDVTFTFHVDAIAQEEDEAVRLQLTVSQAVLNRFDGQFDNSVFFLDTADLTIMDSDSLAIFFTEEDYRSAEPELTMPVRVSKSNRIATPVIVRVTPVTIPPPDNNIISVLSPVKADLDDFDNSEIVITFQPDETGQQMNDVDTPVPIVNDRVNEAEEQNFMVTLDLVNATDESRVDIERIDALCRIIDDDDIAIGFERPAYMFLEPEDEANIVDVVFLAKENNVTSEQTFQIAITVTRDTPDQSIQPAEEGFREDYQIASVLVLRMEPQEQRKAFNFRLFGDDLAEGTEAFQLSPAAITDSPSFLGPTVLSPSTFVIIEDDDPVVIGFERSYTVNEDDGFLEVCASISSPPNDSQIFLEVTLTVNTVQGTADEEDYESITPNDGSVFLQFNDDTRRSCFNLMIIDDDVAESPESLSIELVYSPFLPPPSGVILDPNVTTVEILDNDAVISPPVNDTVVGDPLLTVPLFIRNKTFIADVGPDDPINLCYEVRAEQGVVYNLVSDMCVTVNAHYAQVRPNERLNIIDAIYVRAVDSEGNCHNIAVNLDQCMPSVNLSEVQMLNSNGIYVRKIRNRVRIAVPNCREQDLVMWVFCQNNVLQSTIVPDTTFNAEMIRFVISRGFSLQESSHGILGQFWNIPIDVERYVGTQVDGTDPGPNAYTVTVNYPGQQARVFVGWLYQITWEKRLEYCIYAGNSQGGSSVEIPSPFNDPVLEGMYTDYMISTPFGNEFQFNHFEEGRCN